MTREQCLEVINKDNQKSGLYQFVLFYRSPITEKVEHRIMYSPQYAEGIHWLDSVMPFYKERKIPFTAYICGGFYDSEGTLFPY